MKRLKKLDEISDRSKLYFVHRDIFTVSLYNINKFFPIDEEKAGIAEGRLEIGNYSKKKYFLIYESVINNRSRIGISQERLDKEEVYIFDPFEDLF